MRRLTVPIHLLVSQSSNFDILCPWPNGQCLIGLSFSFHKKFWGKNMEAKEQEWCNKELMDDDVDETVEDTDDDADEAGCYDIGIGGYRKYSIAYRGR